MEYAESIADSVGKWVKRDDRLSEILFRCLAALIVVYGTATILFFHRDAVFGPLVLALVIFGSWFGVFMVIALREKRSLRRDMEAALRDPRFNGETAFQIIVAVSKLKGYGVLEDVVPVVVREADRFGALQA
jgi:hypothetical protein